MGSIWSLPTATHFRMTRHTPSSAPCLLDNSHQSLHHYSVTQLSVVLLNIISGIGQVKQCAVYVFYVVTVVHSEEFRWSTVESLSVIVTIAQPTPRVPGFPPWGRIKAGPELQVTELFSLYSPGALPKRQSFSSLPWSSTAKIVQRLRPVSATMPNLTTSSYNPPFLILHMIFSSNALFFRGLTHTSLTSSLHISAILAFLPSPWASNIS